MSVSSRGFNTSLEGVSLLLLFVDNDHVSSTDSGMSFKEVGLSVAASVLASIFGAAGRSDLF